MAYDPADLKLPHWLLAFLDWAIRLRLPVWPGWHAGMTRSGALYASTMMGVIAAAFYSGNNLLYLCAAMLVSLAIAAFVHGVLVLLAVPDFSTCMPETSTAGGVAVVRRTLAGKPAASAIIRAAWQGNGRNVECTIRLADEATLLMRLHAPCRSLFSFSSLLLSTEAPLGLWRLERRLDTARWTWAVIPEAAPTFNLPSHRPSHTGEPGSHEGEEWRDLRGYYPGDMPSRIHWRKSTASEWDTGTWMVKRFAQPEASDTEEMLRVDLRGPSGPAFERLLGQVVGWIQEHPEGRVILGRREFDPGGGLHQSVWQAIASAQPEPDPPAGDGGIILSMMKDMHAA
ncbi:MAG: DUF58 domain-containing protein [Mariprofundaceae bacterium]|nr:DUF58 domain-containing protein [Mariprofundaceae bacterium]